jgi:VanZ family protein
MQINDAPVYKKIIAWLPVLIWTGMLFYFSSQTAPESTALSGKTIRALLAIFKPEFLTMTALQQTQLVAGLQHLVRNTAHFLSYFLLAILCMSALRQHHLQQGQQNAIALLICMGYALTDEIHQLFVAGRAFEFTDLGVDLSGTMTGLFLVLLVRRWWLRRGSGDEENHA